MSVSMNMSQANILFGSRTRQDTNKYGGWMKQSDQSDSSKDVRDMKRMLRGLQKEEDNSFINNIVSDSFSYADSIRSAREKSKNTAVQKKRLIYRFKSISSQILRSKTSLSARQVATKAKREVIRLKNQRLSGEYDDKEVRSAIAHAQAMERVAKKKARHLLEEEMMKVTGGPCLGEIGEREDEKNKDIDEAMEDAMAAQMPAENDNGYIQDDVTRAAQEQLQAAQDMYETQMAQLQDMMQSMSEMTSMIQEQMAESSEDMMSDFMDEMADSMEEMLENSGLSELAEGLEAIEVEMDPADLKMLKIKHRSEELRDMAKADAEYLKAVFDRLEKAKEAAMQGSSNANNNSSSFGGSAPGGSTIVVRSEPAPAPTAQVDVASTPDATTASAPVPAMGGNIDVSL